MSEKSKLLPQMLLKGLAGFALLGLLLFGCAGSLAYTGGWLLVAPLAALMAAMGVFLLVKSPETLARRLKSKESENAQKGYIALTGGLFLLSFALGGLSFRFGWAQLPLPGMVAGLIVMILGYAMYAAVIRQNAYAARVVEVQQGQTVISTGLYAVVRHPMYLACLLVFVPMPLVLGAWLALVPMLCLPVMLVLRIKNEEQVLLAGLPGYAEYTQKTKYRLLPFIW